MEVSQLRDQILLLQHNEKDYQDLNFLFTNLEHRYNLLVEEKSRMELEQNRRNEFNMEAIAMHRAEIDQLREELSGERINHPQYKEQIEYLMYENEQLTDEVNSLRDAYTKIVQQIQEQDESYHQQLASKQQYIDNLSFQIKQINELKQQQERKNISEIEAKHQQNWRVDKYLNEIEGYKSQNEKLTADNKLCARQVERLEQQIVNYKEQMTVLTADLGKMQHQVSQLSKEQHMNKQSKSTQQLQLEVDIKHLKSANAALTDKNQHLTEQLETLINNNQQLIVECDCIRTKLNDLENNKHLVQNQYAKSLNKMQEERRIIKDYLQRQRQVRENRGSIDNDMSKCVDDFSKYNRIL